MWKNWLRCNGVVDANLMLYRNADYGGCPLFYEGFTITPKFPLNCLLIESLMRLLSAVSNVPYWKNYSPRRLYVHNIITSKYFDLAIAAVIGRIFPKSELQN